MRQVWKRKQRANEIVYIFRFLLYVRRFNTLINVFFFFSVFFFCFFFSFHLRYSTLFHFLYLYVCIYVNTMRNAIRIQYWLHVCSLRLIDIAIICWANRAILFITLLFVQFWSFSFLSISFFFSFIIYFFIFLIEKEMRERLTIVDLVRRMQFFLCANFANRLWHNSV